MQQASSKIILICQVLIVFGVFVKFYGINDPWKRNDHYNFGGVWTTTYAECLKTTPLSVSKGIPHTHCWTGSPNYYRAHPPTILFAMWGWTNIFGSSEAAYRLFILTFSVFNTFLVFQIARLARPDSQVFPWLSAAFQSCFLGGMYFGTHPDFIGEFTVSFVLLSALFALKNRITAAALFSLLAGISAWPGYISFAPLWLYTLWYGRGRKRVFLMTVFGFTIALLTMMWLHQKTDIFAFLKMKILDPGYVKQTEKGWFEPILFVKNIVSSWSRLLSPLFATLGTYELLRGSGKLFFTDWKNRWKNLNVFHMAVMLSGGTGVIYSIIGHEYFMVHVFLYLLMIPGLALLSARFIERFVTEPFEMVFAKKADLIFFTVLGILFLALYPFGIFQSSLKHDVLNSILLALSLIFFIILLYKKRTHLNHRLFVALCFCAVIANASQTINYRNEKDTERSFCEEARKSFEKSGEKLISHTHRSDAKSLLYCRDIPIEYQE